MSRQLSWVAILSLWIGIAQSTPIPEIITGDPKAGAAKTQVCASCHGVDGNGLQGMSDNPKIAGQHEKYLIKQMKDFKGPRLNGIMLSFVKDLSEEDIRDIAAYYASQNTTIGVVPSAYLKIGEQIYRGGNLKTGVPACAACHSPDGGGNALMPAPVLSGQHFEYVAAQMQAFKAGTRKNDPNGMMQDIAKRMTSEEIQAVAQYVSGLH